LGKVLSIEKDKKQVTILLNPTLGGKGEDYY